MNTFRKGKASFSLLLVIALLFVWVPLLPSGAIAREPAASSCVKQPGPFYNYRIIDGTLFAGGSLFKIHRGRGTLKEAILQGLAELKKQGVKTVIKLNNQSEENSYAEGLLEAKLVAEAGLDFFPCPLGNGVVPTHEQTEKMLSLIDQKAYVHCTWGCDRTGAVIATYLRARRGYSGQEAWNAIIKSGTHAGPDNGFAKKTFNRANVLFFWPEVTRENPDVCSIYGIPYNNR